jgi:hypothetical protein
MEDQAIKAMEVKRGYSTNSNSTADSQQKAEKTTPFTEKFEFKGTVSMLKIKENKFIFCSDDKTYYMRFVPYGSGISYNCVEIRFYQDKDYQLHIPTPPGFSIKEFATEYQTSDKQDFSINLHRSPKLRFNGKTIMKMFAQVQLGVNGLEKSVKRLKNVEKDNK